MLTRSHTYATVGMNFIGLYVPRLLLWVYALIKKKKRVRTKQDDTLVHVISRIQLITKLVRSIRAAGPTLSLGAHHLPLRPSPAARCCSARGHPGQQGTWKKKKKQTRKIITFILVLSFNTTYYKRKLGFKVNRHVLKGKRILSSSLIPVLCYPVGLTGFFPKPA